MQAEGMESGRQQIPVLRLRDLYRIALGLPARSSEGVRLEGDPNDVPTLNEVHEMSRWLRYQNPRLDMLPLESRVWWLAPSLASEMREFMTTRCWNALTRAGLIEQSERLAAVTVGDLLNIWAFGWRSLVDLLTAQEEAAISIAPGQNIALKPKRVGRDAVSRRWKAVRDVLVRISKDPEANRFPTTDPRLKLNKKVPGRRARTLGELAQWVAAHAERFGLSVVEGFAEEAERLLAEIPAWSERTLKEEMEEAVRLLAGSERNTQLIMLRFGLSGPDRLTLQEIADHEGLTRQRVSQIVRKFESRRESVSLYLPGLRRLLLRLRKVTPLGLRQATRALQGEGVLLAGCDLARICRALSLFFGDSVKLEPIGGTFVIEESSRGAGAEIGRLFDATVREVLKQTNAAHLNELVSLFREHGIRVEPGLLVEIVDYHPDLKWLDQTDGWFWNPNQGRQPLLRRIQKVLAVCGPLAPDATVAMLRRDRRIRHKVPPARVIKAIAKRSGIRERGDGKLELAQEIDPKGLITFPEEVILSVLEDHGGQMRRAQLWEVCTQEWGLNPVTFAAAVDGVLFDTDEGVVRLAGQDYAEVELNSDGIAAQPLQRTFVDYEWLEDGCLRMSVTVGHSFLRTGILGLPTALARWLPTEVLLLEAHGGGHVLRHRERSPNQWGYGPFLRGYGIHVGDAFEIVYDLQARRAQVGRVVRRAVPSYVEEVQQAPE